VFHEAAQCFRRAITRKEATDTGMAMVLLALIFWFVTRDARWTWAAAALLVLAMTVPLAFTPVARV
jgi:multisubunit Na+/H+ antiporter MnhG subunit